MSIFGSTNPYVIFVIPIVITVVLVTLLVVLAVCCYRRRRKSRRRARRERRRQRRQQQCHGASVCHGSGAGVNINVSITDPTSSCSIQPVELPPSYDEAIRSPDTITQARRSMLRRCPSDPPPPYEATAAPQPDSANCRTSHTHTMSQPAMANQTGQHEVANGNAQHSHSMSQPISIIAAICPPQETSTPIPERRNMTLDYRRHQRSSSNPPANLTPTRNFENMEPLTPDFCTIRHVHRSRPKSTSEINQYETIMPSHENLYDRSQSVNDLDNEHQRSYSFPAFQQGSANEGFIQLETDSPHQRSVSHDQLHSRNYNVLDDANEPSNLRNVAQNLLRRHGLENNVEDGQSQQRQHATFHDRDDAFQIYDRLPITRSVESYSRDANNMQSRESEYMKNVSSRRDGVPRNKCDRYVSSNVTYQHFKRHSDSEMLRNERRGCCDVESISSQFAAQTNTERRCHVGYQNSNPYDGTLQQNQERNQTYNVHIQTRDLCSNVHVPSIENSRIVHHFLPNLRQSQDMVSVSVPKENGVDQPEQMMHLHRFHTHQSQPSSHREFVNKDNIGDKQIYTKPNSLELTINVSDSLRMSNRTVPFVYIDGMESGALKGVYV